MAKVCVVVARIVDIFAEKAAKSRPGRSPDEKQRHQENIACRQVLRRIRKSVSTILREISAAGANVEATLKKTLQALDSKFLSQRLQ